MPLFLVTLLGAILLFFVPPHYIGMVAIGSTINVAGSYMDLAVFLYTFLLPKISYIQPAEGFVRHILASMMNRTGKFAC